MVKRTKRLKIIAITIIFISLQLPGATTAFAALPATGSYAPATNYTGIVYSLPEGFSVRDIDKAGFDFVEAQAIDNTVTGSGGETDITPLPETTAN